MKQSEQKPEATREEGDGSLENCAVLVISTSQMARGAKLGELNALKLPVSTLVTRFPR